MKLQAQTSMCSPDARIKIKLLVLHHLHYKSSAVTHDPDTNEAIASTGHITGEIGKKKKKKAAQREAAEMDFIVMQSRAKDTFKYLFICRRATGGRERCWIASGADMYDMLEAPAMQWGVYDDNLQSQLIV